MVFALINQRDDIVVEVEVWIADGEIRFEAELNLGAYTYTLLRLRSEEEGVNGSTMVARYAGDLTRIMRSRERVEEIHEDGGDIWTHMRELFKCAAEKFGLMYHED